MALWKLRQGRHKVRAPSHQGWPTEGCLVQHHHVVEEVTAYGSILLSKKTQQSNLPQILLWQTTDFFLIIFCDLALPQGQIQTPQPAFHSPLSLGLHHHLHTAYNNCHTSLPSVLLLQAGSSAGLARMPLVLTFPLPSCPYLFCAFDLPQLSKLWEACALRQSSFFSLLLFWVPGQDFKGSFHWSF